MSKLRVKCNMIITMDTYERALEKMEQAIDKIKDAFSKKYIYISRAHGKVAEVTLIPYEKELDYVLMDNEDLFRLNGEKVFISDDVLVNIEKMVRNNDFRNILDMPVYKFTDLKIIEKDILHWSIISSKLNQRMDTKNLEEFLTTS